MAVRPPWARVTSSEFADNFGRLLYDHERWMIDGVRLVHDTGIWFEVEGKDDIGRTHRLSVGLGENDPVEVKIAHSVFDFAYDSLVQKLRHKAAKPMMGEMMVLVKLCSE